SVGKCALTAVPWENLCTRICPPYGIVLRSAHASSPLFFAARGTPSFLCSLEPRGAERQEALARNAVPVARLAIGPVSLAKETIRPITPAGAPLGAPPRQGYGRNS